jgi:hypothetical protein
MGRSIPHPIPNTGVNCGESLVSSVAQTQFACLRGSFLHIYRVSLLHDDAFRILAEPSNNSKESGRSQLFAVILAFEQFVEEIPKGQN